MGIDITTRIEKLPHSFKMHSSMCLELKNLVDSIMSIFPDIEDARPGSSSGIQTLCLLNKALEKAKLLLQYCSESSKLYMAVTGDGILSRGCRAKKLLEQSLSDIRSMVPTVLAIKITQIVQDLRSTVLSLEPSEEEAGKAVRELMQLSTSSPDEIRDFHFAALKLHLSTPEAIVIERRSLNAVEAGCTDFNSSFSTESGTEVTDSTHREVEIGSLSSLLKMAESGADHLQEDAMNTLKSLSSSNEICLEMVSLGFVKNLTSLLQQIVFSKQSIIILRNLCNTEKGRVCITETPGCLASIAELLDSDVTEEQENAISILLQLCVEKIEYCSLVVREGVDIYSSLFLISNNGTEEAKVGASELLRALEEVDSNREEESSTLEGATTSQTVITPVKHQEPMLTTPSLKKSGLFGLRFPFSRRRKVC
ncbi:hypothetical protein YC2023_032905 [Brassica napus]